MATIPTVHLPDNQTAVLKTMGYTPLLFGVAVVNLYKAFPESLLSAYKKLLKQEWGTGYDLVFNESIRGLTEVYKVPVAVMYSELPLPTKLLKALDAIQTHSVEEKDRLVHQTLTNLSERLMETIKPGKQTEDKPIGYKVLSLTERRLISTYFGSTIDAINRCLWLVDDKPMDLPHLLKTQARKYSKGKEPATVVFDEITSLNSWAFITKLMERLYVAGLIPKVPKGSTDVHQPLLDLLSGRIETQPEWYKNPVIVELLNW